MIPWLSCCHLIVHKLIVRMESGEVFHLPAPKKRKIQKPNYEDIGCSWVPLQLLLLCSMNWCGMCQNIYLMFIIFLFLPCNLLFLIIEMWIFVKMTKKKNWFKKAWKCSMPQGYLISYNTCKHSVFFFMWIICRMNWSTFEAIKRVDICSCLLWNIWQAKSSDKTATGAYPWQIRRFIGTSGNISSDISGCKLIYQYCRVVAPSCYKV